MLDHIQLLIFDLDGTLVDSQYDLCDAVNHALRKLGRPLIAYEETPPLLGSGLSFLLRKAAGTDDEAVIEKAREYFDEYYSEHHADKTRPYPGVEETLQQLSDKKKAVYSNKLQHFTTRITEELKLEPYFDKVMGAQPDRYALKPNPEGIRIILSECGVPASQALMVGDSTHDIEAGRAAGLRTCAVTYGYRPEEILRRSKPDFVIHEFKELLHLQ